MSADPDGILPRAEAIETAVSHQEYVEKAFGGGCFIDVKAAFDEKALRAAGVTVWRL